MLFNDIYKPDREKEEIRFYQSINFLLYIANLDQPR